MRLHIFLILFFAISVLTASVGFQVAAYGSEILPSGVERMHAQCVWDNNRDLIVDQGANAGQNVKIAVIDRGVDYYVNGTGHKVYHPDLRDNIAGGLGFRYRWQINVTEEVEDHEDTEDWGNGHGTQVAGIIAAVDNDVGVIGVAPKVEIYALKLCTMSHEEVIAAIYWAVNHGIRIISMSFGSYVDYPGLHVACDYAYANGVLLIAAAGNDGINSIGYPARYSSVIAVGAVYPNDTWCEWSNTGPELDYVAPGVNITSTDINEGYKITEGTSMAAPHVTGAVALVVASKPDPDIGNGDEIWQNYEVLLMFQDWVLDLGPPGWDSQYGYGLVNAWGSCQRPAGDINNDLRCNILDAIIVAGAFNSRPGSPKWDPRADLDINNVVDILDAMIIANNFGKIDP